MCRTHFETEAESIRIAMRETYTSREILKMNSQNHFVCSVRNTNEYPKRLEEYDIDEQFSDIDEHFKNFKDTFMQFARE